MRLALLSSTHATRVVELVLIGPACFGPPHVPGPLAVQAVRAPEHRERFRKRGVSERTGLLVARIFDRNELDPRRQAPAAAATERELFAILEGLGPAELGL